MFRTNYDRYVVHTNPGSPIKINYVGQVTKRGDIDVVESGADNLYMFIQSFADSCDINVLISRFNNGDTSALNQRVGQYLDVTDCPKSLADAFEMVQKASDIFAGLPIEIRREYDSNVGKFIEDIGSDHFNNLFGSKPQPGSDPDKSVDNGSTGSE